MRLRFVKLQIFECYTPVTWYLASPLRASVCARIVGALAGGAIIESGSNANGEWTRYADGTQICLINAVVPFSQNATSAYCTFTLPAAFASSNYRASCIGTRTEITYVVIRNKAVSSMEIVVSLKAPSQSDIDLGVDIIAIGKWK